MLWVPGAMLGAGVAGVPCTSSTSDRLDRRYRCRRRRRATQPASIEEVAACEVYELICGVCATPIMPLFAQACRCTQEQSVLKAFSQFFQRWGHRNCEGAQDPS